MVTSQLLTIEEAAHFLNVSKTTLRRWTKLGTLPCVRVGARRERRFEQSDLSRLLDTDAPSASFKRVPPGSLHELSPQPL